MPTSTLRRSVLPAIALILASGAARAGAAEDCADALIGPAARIAACDAAIAAAADPLERAGLLVQRAGANRLRADHEAVLADLAEAERIAPDAPPELRADMLVQRSEVFRLRDDFDAALADIAEAERLVPGSADPVVNRGLVLHDQGDMEGAVAQLARAVRLEPEDPRAVLAAMYVLYGAGDYEGCLKLGAEAERIAPARPQTWFYRGNCLRELGRTEEAVADYERAEEIGLPGAGDRAALLDNLSMSYLDLGRAQDAVEAARRAVALDPSQEGARMSLVSALAATGAAEEAVAAYREAQAAGVEDTMGQANNLAWSLYLGGRHEEALRIMEEWVAAHPSPSGDQHYEFDTLAHIQAALGRTEEALASFARAIEIGGPELRAHYEARLAELGFAPGEGGFDAALRACVETGEECRISP